MAPHVVNLDSYFGRIRYGGQANADVATLQALHAAHVDRIAFENIDVQRGVPIRLDLPSLEAKLVQRSRGGYCFEQNTLFMHVLRAIGFDVRAHEARVRQGSGGAIRPRTHMVLIVTVAGREWLADVGFGGDGLLAPVALDGAAQSESGRTIRVTTEGDLQVLQQQREGDWEDLYAVAPGDVHPVDIELANWYTSTHPDSIFRKTLTAQRVTRDERHILRNLSYTTVRRTRAETRTIDRAELVPLLQETFGLDVGDATFPAVDGA